MSDSTDTIFHLATPAEWDAAQSSGSYHQSTRGKSLAEVGFVHCAFAHQVVGVANRFYGDLSQLMVLEIDRATLDAEVRVEPGEPGSDEVFPHVYGSFRTTEVRTATKWNRDGLWQNPPIANQRLS